MLHDLRDKQRMFGGGNLEENQDSIELSNRTSRGE